MFKELLFEQENGAGQPYRIVFAERQVLQLFVHATICFHVFSLCIVQDLAGLTSRLVLTILGVSRGLKWCHVIYILGASRGLLTLAGFKFNAVSTFYGLECGLLIFSS